MTSRLPYPQCPNYAALYSQSLAGRLPEDVFELGTSECVKSLLQKCWTTAPEARIAMDECLSYLDLKRLSRIKYDRIPDVLKADISNEWFAVKNPLLPSWHSFRTFTVQHLTFPGEGPTVFKEMLVSPDGLSIVASTGCPFWPSDRRLEVQRYSQTFEPLG